MQLILRNDDWARVGLPRLCLLLMLLAVLRVAWGIYDWDSTYDEYWHLRWSERALTEQNFDREVSNFASTTPITMLNAGAKLVAQSLGVSSPVVLEKVARIPTLCGFVLLLLAAYWLARELGDGRAGMIAAALTALDPNLISHSALTTVDTFFALVNLTFLLQAIRFYRNVSLLNAGLLAAIVGIGFVTKLTSVLFLPILLVLLPAAIYRRSVKELIWRLPVLFLFGLGVIFLVINAAYLFQDVGFRLRSIALYSSFMRDLVSLAPFLYLPLPEAFVGGFDQVLSIERAMPWNTVIFDHYYSDGVWYYFSVNWLMKTPLGIIGLIAVGIGLLINRARTRKRETGAVFNWRAKPRFIDLEVRTAGLIMLLVLWLIYLVYFNFVFRTHVGLRYILMCLPMVYVLTGAVLARWSKTIRGGALITLLLCVALIEQVPFLGNSLSFSNALIQDKKLAYYWLTDSNIDWGQNYSKVLARVARDYPNAHVNPPHIMPGTNVVRLNFLTGVFRNFEQHRWVRENLEPTAHLGHTHLVYEVSQQQFRTFLAEQNSADSLTDLSSCVIPVAVRSPYRHNAYLPATGRLCIDYPPGPVRIELLSGIGVIGRRSEENPRLCDGYRLSIGESVIFDLTSRPSQLCLQSEVAGTAWGLSIWDPFVTLR